MLEASSVHHIPTADTHGAVPRNFNTRSGRQLNGTVFTIVQDSAEGDRVIAGSEGNAVAMTG